MSEAPARGPVFYGWTIVGFTLLLQFICVGTAYYSFGVYLKPITSDLETDRFSISLALSMQTLVQALLGPWVGRLVARYSIKALLVGGVVLMSAGFAIMATATHVWQVWLGFGLVTSIGVALTGTVPNNTLLANWFVRRRGTALGISQFGITISGTLLVPATTFLVLEAGWRTTLLIYALALPALLIPLILAFAVKTPEERGLRPDGDPSTEAPPSQAAARSWGMARALRHRDVWCVALIVGPCFMAISAVVLALHSHATDLGLSPMHASYLVALTTLLGAAAKPLFGFLADHFPTRAIAGAALACQIAGVGLLCLAADYRALLCAGFLFGLGYGAMAPLWAIMLAELFGRRGFAEVMGTMMPMVMPFSLLGLPLTTAMFELTGSYSPAFLVILAAYALPLAALLSLRLPGAITAPSEG